jgi:hypothetical protein
VLVGLEETSKSITIGQMRSRDETKGEKKKREGKEGAHGKKGGGVSGEREKRG